MVSKPRKEGRKEGTAMRAIKRSVTTACLLASILVAGCAPGSKPASAPQAPTSGAPAAREAGPASGASYQDPQGRFSVPVPANWEAEARDGYGLLTSPEDKIKVYVLAVDGADIGV